MCISKLYEGMASHWSQGPLSISLQKISAEKGGEKTEPSCTVGGNINWCSHYGDRMAVP